MTPRLQPRRRQGYKKFKWAELCREILELLQCRSVISEQERERG